MMQTIRATPADFDLVATVTSGHLFTYWPARGGFRIRNGTEEFFVKQDGAALCFTDTTEDRLRHFFDLDKDIDALHHRLKGDHVLKPQLETYKGIRLVRQDLRQAILTFICSSNNNQQRIKSMVDHLCTSQKHTEESLRAAGFGYRARFISEAQELLSHSFLDALAALSYQEAKERLVALPGVGSKVADCILAYSELAHGEAFPADVWVRRALTHWYRFRAPLTDRNISSWARRFGNDAAYAQHYLFLAAQEHRSSLQSTQMR